MVKFSRYEEDEKRKSSLIRSVQSAKANDATHLKRHRCANEDYHPRDPVNILEPANRSLPQRSWLVVQCRNVPSPDKLFKTSDAGESLLLTCDVKKLSVCNLEKRDTERDQNAHEPVLGSTWKHRQYDIPDEDGNTI